MWLLDRCEMSWYVVGAHCGCSPVVRLFTRPRGEVRDHTDHKTQLYKHCQRAQTGHQLPSTHEGLHASRREFFYPYFLVCGTKEKNL